MAGREGEPGASGARVPALDGVRGLAILAVVIHHAFPPADSAEARFERLVLRVAENGWIGVDLFFALSGFLITSILLETKGTDGYFRNFMMRRVLRILPLYYVFLAVAFLALPAIAPHHPELAKLTAGRFAWYATYVPNINIFLHGDWDAVWVEHTWSLAIEEQFYLVWPAVVSLLSLRALRVTCVVGALVSIAIRTAIVITMPTGGRATAFVLLPAHMDGLLFGAAVATLAGSRHLLRAFGIACVAGLVAMVALPIVGLGYEVTHYALGVGCASLAFAALVGLAARSPAGARIARFFSVAPLRTLGTYSYGLYLVHQPLFRAFAPVVARIPGPAPLRWSVSLFCVGGLSLAIAVLVYHAFEKRFLGLKRFFAPRARVRTITP
jgi:peptidoglycan/LPS O-acetylase OafA/YrhL